MEKNLMPRMLLLGIFLAFGLVAFVAGSLFAGEPEVQSKPSQNIKQRKLAPSDSLAKLLRSSDKKSSTESKLTTKKKTSRLKSAHHKFKTWKSLSSRKTTVSKKSAYNKSKSKSLKKAIHHKAKPANKLASDKPKTD
jgi:hypothetical protein